MEILQGIDFYNCLLKAIASSMKITNAVDLAARHLAHTCHWITCHWGIGLVWFALIGFFT